MNIKLLPLVMVFFVGGCFNKKWKQKPEHVYLENTTENERSEDLS